MIPASLELHLEKCSGVCVCEQSREDEQQSKETEAESRLHLGQSRTDCGPRRRFPNSRVRCVLWVCGEGVSLRSCRFTPRPLRGFDTSGRGISGAHSLGGVRSYPLSSHHPYHGRISIVSGEMRALLPVPTSARSL